MSTLRPFLQRTAKRNDLMRSGSKCPMSFSINSTLCFTSY